MKKILVIFILCMITTPGFSANISRENIDVDANYISDGDTYFMCNLRSSIPNTDINGITNATFQKCNLFGINIDGSNVLVQSNLIDTTYVEPEASIEEQLVKEKERTTQLETFIRDSRLIVPIKEVSL